MSYNDRRKLVAAMLLAALLAGCHSGNDDDDGSGGPPETPPPQRGTLLQNPPTHLSTVTTTDLLAKLAGGSDEVKQVLALFGEAECSIDVHQIQYHTVDAGGGATTASGALMVPNGPSDACEGPRPILLYAHGTTTDRDFNIANLDDTANAEGLIIAAVFAAHGYIVVAPNYAGYDTSTLQYHPYLNAEQSSSEMIDALTAARSALPTQLAAGTSDNGKLFITGYSQGGHVAMATHRAMQEAAMTVTASGPMSWPYALAAFGDAVFFGQVNASAPLVFTFAIAGYQHAYGDIYAAPTDIFEARYATGIDTLLPTTLPRSALFEQGKLPHDQLFSGTPPDPAFAANTPATEPAALAPIFAAGFGPDNLVTNGYRLAYLDDALANPDGGWPTTTTGAPATAPANTLRRAFKANDLRNWTPASPMLLCAGSQDPTVFFLNTQLLQGYWAASGGNPPVTVLDVDSAKTDGDPFDELKTGFAAFKDLIAAAAVAGGADDGGASAVAEAYHSTLVPPFCIAAVRSTFDGL